MIWGYHHFRKPPIIAGQPTPPQQAQVELSPVYAQRDATFIEVKTGEKGLCLRTESDVLSPIFGRGSDVEIWKAWGFV